MGYFTIAISVLLLVGLSDQGVPTKFAQNWPLPIPYMINSQYTADQKAKIEAGIQTIMENTCVDFKEDSGSEQKMEYANLNKCSSNVGDSRNWGIVYPGNHKVSLALYCLNIGNVQHETMHALGFQHTQNHPHRDEYLTVNWNNINQSPTNYTKNFMKVALDDFFDYGIPYEYASRMHYEAYEMSNGNGPALQSKDPDYIYSMGTAKTLSFYDWKMINIRYSCNASCTNPITCQNGGYRHPRDCNRCKCTDFHDGKFCEIERGLVDLSLQKEPFVIEHKETLYTTNGPDIHNWSNFNVYPVRVIKAPENRRIRITIEKIGSVAFAEPQNCFFGVEIADGDIALTGKKFCASSHAGRSFASKSNVVGYRAYSLKEKPFESRIVFSIEPETGVPTTTTTPPTTSTVTTTPTKATTTTLTTITTKPTTPTTTTVPTTTTTKPTTTTSTVTTTTSAPTTTSTTTPSVPTVTKRPRPFPPKPVLSPENCAKWNVFAYDEKTSRCLASVTMICTEQDWEDAQTKSYAACKSAAPTPTPGPEPNDCRPSHVYERVPGEPVDALYGKRCEEPNFCDPRASCVLGKRDGVVKAHCCLFAGFESP